MLASVGSDVDLRIDGRATGLAVISSSTSVCQQAVVPKKSRMKLRQRWHHLAAPGERENVSYHFIAPPDALLRALALRFAPSARCTHHSRRLSAPVSPAAALTSPPVLPPPRRPRALSLTRAHGGRLLAALTGAAIWLTDQSLRSCARHHRGYLPVPWNSRIRPRVSAD